MNMKPLRIKHSESGSSLLSIVAAMAFLGLTVFSSMAYLDFLNKQTVSLKQDFSLTLIKSNILRSLQSPTSWTNTINDDANLFKSCTSDPVNCLAVKQFVPLRIHDILNNLTVDGNQGSWYDYAGKLCSSQTCPVQVKSQWRGVCNAEGTCTQAYVELDFLIRDKNGTQSKSKVSYLKNYFIGTSQKSLTTNVTFTSGDVSNATAKIIVILDSSESMADNFAKVKKGLSGIMTKLAGKAVQVYFYTTAGLEVGWGGNAVYTDPTYVDYPKISSFIPRTIATGTYENILHVDMSRKINAPIDPTLSEAMILSRLESIFATYIAVPGSDKESGLCTLHRILIDEGPNKILNPSDLAFFILVTDEDDTLMSTANVINDCNKKMEDYVYTNTYKVWAICNPEIETCDKFNASVVLAGNITTMTYKEKINDTIFTRYHELCGLISANNAPGYNPCPFSTGIFNCGANEINFINREGIKNIVECTTNTRLVHVRLDFTEHDNPSNALNLKNNFCSGLPFTFNSVYYNNLKSFLSTNGYTYANLDDCKSDAFKIAEQTISYTSLRYTQMDDLFTNNDFIDTARKLALQTHLVTTLKSKFGETGFSVRAFIQDPVKDVGLCALTDGAYGTAYVNFLNALASPISGYESICNDTYDFSFDTLGMTILTKLNNTYIFTQLTNTDKITGISITRSGSSFTMDPTKYEVVGNKVIFQEGNLQEGDQITLLLNGSTTGNW